MQQFPIYTSRGDWAALLLANGLLYNSQGEWIGWVDKSANVYSTLGLTVGWLAKDFRVLCRREITMPLTRYTPPAHEKRISVPRSVPLAPLMGDLPYDVADVFEEMPDRLSPMDFAQVADID